MPMRPAQAADTRVLRVCADPDNLPFSNEARDGFENRIVEAIAASLDARVDYTWWEQRRGFARKTLGQGLCDLWPGVATGLPGMATTTPYYRSSYVFVTRRDAHLDLATFDDPRLHALRIGVQMIGNDATNTPPAHALARRGIVANVRGFMVYDDAGTTSPIMQAVADGTIDVALVWGPTAGYFARRSDVPLALAKTPQNDGAALPMTFDIAMGVRKNDPALRADVERALAADRERIGGILDSFGVPR